MFVGPQRRVHCLLPLLPAPARIVDQHVHEQVVVGGRGGLLADHGLHLLGLQPGLGLLFGLLLLLLSSSSVRRHV